ncbi:23S rRNA (uracil(1939)-C(5))-methyltransferase RlmD [Halioxenophilus sp. WMMB6]|uniref:23S rRNA (uracil(1939)-C(5))-methyltransferase RlmD n=1 Tax=Halioxenophilus sp. WMMB6 TaxID=3073815 RepID=UPI00295F36AE|nr:23S rRNA (uracil(1939)-C(5))-methyltransferase RlmD [Halioxenophilus sp. WMMB6]
MAKFFQPKSRALPGPLELDVTGFSSEGRGIAHHQGKAVFIEGALPGERVLAKFVSAASGVLQAVAAKVLQAAPERCPPGCEIASQCGGCDWLHIASDQQLAWKQQLLLEQLARKLPLADADIAEPISSPSWGYRSRTRLAYWRDKSNHWALGFRAAGSKSVVPISHCPVLTPPLTSILPWLQKALRQIGAIVGLGHVELIDAEGRQAVLLRAVKPLSESALTALLGAANAAGFDLWLQSGDDSPQCLNQTENPLYYYSLPAFALRIGYAVTDFSQVNQAVNQAMISQAINWMAGALPNLDQAQVLDLFCGVGNFSLPIARQAGQVVGIEVSETMVERAQENAEQNGIENASFAAADLAGDEFNGPWLNQTYDAVLLDPPRAGAKGALPLIRKLRIPVLVYVSCNPATFVRDAEQLVSYGYQLQRVGVMDMFPQTKHVECMALFRRLN